MHYTFPDQKELVEEYEASTGDILGELKNHMFERLEKLCSVSKYFIMLLLKLQDLIFSY